MIAKWTSRKWWAFLAALVAAVGGLLTGEITFPQFLLALAAASASYQLGEGLADMGGRR